MKKVLAILCSAALALSLFNGVFAEGEVNLAFGATPIVDSVHKDNGWGAEPSTMVDGQYNTRWQSNNDVTGTNEVYVGLVWDEAVTADTFVFVWENSSPGTDYEIYIATTAGGTPGVIDQTRFAEVCYNQGDINWTKVESGITKNRVDFTEGGAECKDTVVFDEDVTIYAIKFVCKSAGDDKNKNMSCHEIEVYNAVVEEEEPATIGDGVVKAETAVVDGVKSVFVATNVAEADVPAGASIKAVFSFTANGTLVEGEKLITAAYTSIALGESELTAAAIDGADAADYVTGILFVNVPESVNKNDIVVNFYIAE